MSGNRRTGHIEWREILDALESPSGPSADLQAHVQGCSRCRELRQSAEQLLGALRRARLQRVPDSLAVRTLERVLEQGAAAAAAAAGQSAWQELLSGLAAGLDELRTRLAADSLAPALAVRGHDPAGTQTLLFETDAFSVAVALGRVEPHAGGTLRGQVVPLAGDRLPGGSRAVLHWPDTLVETALSDVGEFAFSEVPAAPLRLAVILGSQFLQLGPLRAAPSGGEPNGANA